MEAAANSALVGWLRLLGWEVETGRDGDNYVAVARRPSDCGDDDLVAVATTDCAARLPREIFRVAFDRFDARRTASAGYAAAA
jgi:hypothetical protein